MAFTQITVTGSYLDPTGQPETGWAVFQLSEQMTNDGVAATTEPVVAPLDGEGNLSIVLYATDDPDTLPTDAVYNVSLHLSGGIQTFTTTVPAASAGGTMRLGAATLTASFLSRVNYAATVTGWTLLGTAASDGFYESDIVHNTGDGKYYVFSTKNNNSTIYRAHSDLTLLAAQTPVAVAPAVWYPTVSKAGSSWYLWGTSSSTATSLCTASGANSPGAFSLVGACKKNSPISHPTVGIIDSHIRYNSADGYWYMVGLSVEGYAGSEWPVVIWRCSDPPGAAQYWTQVGNVYDIFANTGLPSWAVNPTTHLFDVFDPDLVNPAPGEWYLSFSGYDGTTRSNGIIALDDSWRATGSAVLLTTAYSDVNYVQSPDGIVPDRLFGFAGTTFACLDLPL